MSSTLALLALSSLQRRAHEQQRDPAMVAMLSAMRALQCTAELSQFAPLADADLRKAVSEVTAWASLARNRVESREFFKSSGLEVAEEAHATRDTFAGLVLPLSGLADAVVSNFPQTAHDQHAGALRLFQAACDVVDLATVRAERLGAPDEPTRLAARFFRLCNSRMAQTKLQSALTRLTEGTQGGEFHDTSRLSLLMADLGSLVAEALTHLSFADMLVHSGGGGERALLLSRGFVLSRVRSMARLAVTWRARPVSEALQTLDTLLRSACARLEQAELLATTVLREALLSAQVERAATLYQAVQREEGEATRASCAVCLEQFGRGDLVSRTRCCRQVLHSRCLAAWTRQNHPRTVAVSRCCPLCRSHVFI